MALLESKTSYVKFPHVFVPSLWLGEGERRWPLLLLLLWLLLLLRWGRGGRRGGGRVPCRRGAPAEVHLGDDGGHGVAAPAAAPLVEVQRLKGIVELI